MTESTAPPATTARLYVAARYHARAALDLAQAPWDEHRALDIATRAGSVVELLAKTLLAQHDERLITQRDAHQHLLDAVLQRSGRPPTTAFKPSMKQTVDARVAVELVQRLGPDIERHGRAAKDIVLRARNDAVHMALPRDRSALEMVLTRMSDFADAVLTALDLETQDFWGSHTPAVRRRVDEHRAEVLLGARALMDTARRRYEDLRTGIGEEAWANVLRALQERKQDVGELDAELACPACENTATVAWSSDVEIDVDHGEAIYYASYALEGLWCPVCSLHLGADQVESLQLENMPDVGEIAAAQEEMLSERAYELWQSQ